LYSHLKAAFESQNFYSHRFFRVFFSFPHLLMLPFYRPRLDLCALIVIHYLLSNFSDKDGFLFWLFAKMKTSGVRHDVRMRLHKDEYWRKLVRAASPTCQNATNSISDAIKIIASVPEMECVLKSYLRYIVGLFPWLLCLWHTFLLAK